MLLSPKKAAERLGISQSRVRALIQKGLIQATNIGLDRTVWAIDEQELARFAALERPAHRPRRIIMEPMTKTEIAELNTAYEQAVAANPDESTHVLTHQVAVAANLTTVRTDDESGTLYKNSAGRYVYGWQAGGFDDQIS